MSVRSLKATEIGITKAEKALIEKGWSRQELAEKTFIEGRMVTKGVDIQVVHKFFTGKPVDRKYFVCICKALGLIWEEVIVSNSDSISNTAKSNLENLSVIDALAQEIRLKIQTDVQEHCGKMRVLDMSQPIGLEDIYTDVNILETITGSRRLEINDLLENFDPESEDFERCGLSRIIEKRVPGLEVVRRYSKLMVLGKPGAGKTTFLKYLAIQCVSGKFQAKRVPIFITLKDFAEAKDKPSLIEFINKHFTTYSVTEDQIDMLLKHGRFLILLDGLDEIREEDRKRVLKDIELFSRQFFFSEEFKIKQGEFLRNRNEKWDVLEKLMGELKFSESPKTLSFIAEVLKKISCMSLIQHLEKLNTQRSNKKDIEEEIEKQFNELYPDLLKTTDQGLSFFSLQNPEKIYNNTFIITCRIAAREYYFREFVDVEVTDFDEKQIRMFSQKWFQRKDPKRGEDFVHKINGQKSVKELAISPLLLTLLCLIFETSSDFPTNRSELYEEGVSVLLKKWDAERSIERDQVYKKLSPARKEDLLSHIAWITFNDKNYFFKQRQAERYIAEYIQNLPEARTDQQALHLDSEAVLKSIEAQHGLLVERAKGIYSFSHLTFHEYFAARRVITISNPENLEEFFGYLTEHIIEKRWREVILLAMGMLPDADRLLYLMKQKTDAKIINYKNSEKLCAFLREIRAKSRTDNFPRQASLKALYYSLFQDTLACQERHFNNEDIELLKEYYEANKLLITCLNSDCYVSRTVRENIETNFLLPSSPQANI